MHLIHRGKHPLSALRGGPIDDQFAHLVDTLFQDFLGPYTLAGPRDDGGLAMPRLELGETERAYEIRAELPGVAREDVKVAIDGQRVSIEAECQQANEQREGEQLVYSERATRRYQRSFTLPSEVDDAGAEARLENGILMLTLPKKQGGAAKRLTVQ